MRELCLLGCPVDAASAIQFQVLPWVRGEKVYRRWRVYCTTCKSLDKRRERTRDQQGSAPPVTTFITQGQHILDDDDYYVYNPRTRPAFPLYSHHSSLPSRHFSIEMMGQSKRGNSQKIKGKNGHTIILLISAVLNFAG